MDGGRDAYVRVLDRDDCRTQPGRSPAEPGARSGRERDPTRVGTSTRREKLGAERN